MLLKFRIVYYVPGDLTSEGEDLTFQGGDLIGGDLKVSGEDLFFGLRGGTQEKNLCPKLGENKAQFQGKFEVRFFLFRFILKGIL